MSYLCFYTSLLLRNTAFATFSFLFPFDHFFLLLDAAANAYLAFDFFGG